MKIYKTYKYKLRPSKSQVKTFNHWLSSCRFLYNNALEHRSTVYSSGGGSVRKYDQYNELPNIKKDLPWLAEVYSDTLQEVLDRVDTAFQSFFKKKGTGYPKFHNKHTFNSFVFKRSYKLENNKIKLPKIGWVPYFNSRDIPENGKMKYASIIRESNQYYICICVEFDAKPIIVDDSQAIGIDVGVKRFASLSDGTVIDSPYFLEPNLNKLRILQRRMFRQKKGSNSRNKTKNQISKLHRKIKHQRKDFLHKTTSKIVSDYSSVYVENLKIKNMTKLNSTLSRRMLDNGFFTFKEQLQYKCEFAQKQFHAVPPQYTSQKCSSCGETDRNSRLSQSQYVCTSCGLTINADANAAKNILALGKSYGTQREAIA